MPVLVRFVLFFALAVAARATDFTVHNNGDGSLRDIIETQAGAGDRVVFGPGYADIQLVFDLAIAQDPLVLEVSNGPLTILGPTGAKISIAGALTLDAVAGTLVLATPIDGAGSITKSGAGQVVLGGTNTYAGGTTVQAGRLTASTASLPGNVVTHAELELAQDADGTFAGAITGTGALIKSGTGTLTLTGANAHTGGTRIEAGTLKASTANLAGDVENDAALELDQAVNATFAGAISGTGLLIKSGAGALALSGVNTYSGTTTVQNGTLRAQGGAAIGDLSAVRVLAGATLQLDASETVGSLAGAGAVNLAFHTLTAGADGTDTAFSGVLSGTGALVKTGAGTLTLSGASTYTGGTTIQSGVVRTAGDALADAGAVDVAGRLEVAGDETIGALQGAGTIGIDARLTAGDAADTTFSGAIDGAGGLTKRGAGTLTLSGANTYTGETAVAEGTLRLAGGSAIADDAAVAIAAGATLALDDHEQVGALSGAGAVALGTRTLTAGADVDSTFTGTLTGVGGFTKVGAGTLTLSGANAYAGATTVLAGTLSGDATSLRGPIDNRATVRFDQAANGTFTGTIGGAGNLVKSGSGTLTLSGFNAYTGGTTIEAGTLSGTTASLVGDFANAGVLRFEQATNGTFAGRVTGTGSLTKAGAGTLTLTGANTYSGGTTVSAGTLAGDATSLQGDIASAGAVVFDQAAAGTYAGVISGTGSVTKRGAGTLKFTAPQAYLGVTTISAGRLEVDSTLAGDVDILPGAELGGRGAIRNLAVRGRLAPGNSIGVTSVAGNLTQSAGSSLEVEIDALGNSDRVDVGGTATIAPGASVNVISEPGVYVVGQTYTILTAAGGIVGAFGTVTDDLRFLNASLIQSPNSILLELLRDPATITAAATTGNQRAVAGSLAAIAPRQRGDLGTVLDILQPLTASEIATALDQLAGEVHASLPQLALQDVLTVNQTVARRLRNVENAAALATPIADPWTAWGEGYGFRTDIDADANGRALSFDGTGGLLGLDRTAGTSALFGFFLGASSTDAKVAGLPAAANADGFRGGAYLRSEHDWCNLTAILSYTANDFDVSRRLQFGIVDRVTRAAYTGDSTSAFLETSGYFELGGWEVVPAASLQYTRLESAGFTESGANALDLTVAPTTNDSALASFGARFTYPMEPAAGHTLTPEVRARYLRELADSTRLTTATLGAAPAFTATAADAGQGFAVVGAALTYQAAGGNALYASYDLQSNDRGETHAGQAGLQLRF